MKSTIAQPNLRAQQRVNVVADIVIENPDGCQCACLIANLSRSGVMVSCDQSTADQLTGGNKAFAPRNRAPVKARFSVPVQAIQSEVIAEGNIVHFSRISRDRFHVGIQFEGFEGSGLAYVDQYIRSLLNELGNSI